MDSKICLILAMLVMSMISFVTCQEAVNSTLPSESPKNMSILQQKSNEEMEREMKLFEENSFKIFGKLKAILETAKS